MNGIDYWRLADELTTIQAALLICGYDPTELQDKMRNTSCTPPEGYVAVKHSISSAIKNNSLKVIAGMAQDGRGEYYPDEDLSLVNVEEIKVWLKQKGIIKHFFFFPEGVEDEFLSQDHPRYSPKLAAAVRAWKAMEHESLDGKTAKQAVTKWLRVHAENYGLTDDEGKPMETAIGEIAKIANWKPKGGAPSTPTKASLEEPDAGSKALAAIDKNFEIRQEKKHLNPSEINFDLDPEIPF